MKKTFLVVGMLTAIFVSKAVLDSGAWTQWLQTSSTTYNVTTALPVHSSATGDLDVTGDITVAGTVDGVDVAALYTDKADLLSPSFTTPDLGAATATSLSVSGDVTATGNITATNISGVNTGDQDLSLYTKAYGTQTTYLGTFDPPMLTYDNIYKLLGNSVTEIFFKPDGTKLYALKQSNYSETLYQYSLSTPWDITTISIDAGKILDLSSEGSGLSDFYIDPSGTRLYTNTVNHPLGINQYSLSTAWDISSATYVDTFSSTLSLQMGLFFNSSGTKFYVYRSIDSNQASVLEYDVATPWDITTASSSGVLLNVTPQLEDEDISDVYFKPDGKIMYIEKSNSTTIYKYVLDTAWDLSTASYTNISFDLPGVSGIGSIFFREDNGLKIFSLKYSDSTIHEWNTNYGWFPVSPTQEGDLWIDTNSTPTWQYWTGSAWDSLLTLGSDVYIAGNSALDFNADGVAKTVSYDTTDTQFEFNDSIATTGDITGDELNINTINLDIDDKIVFDVYGTPKYLTHDGILGFSMNDALYSTGSLISNSNIVAAGDISTSTGDLDIGGDTTLSGDLFVDGNGRAQFTNGNTTVVYNPLTYYQSGTTTGEMIITLPHVPTDAYITIEVEARADGYYDLGKLVWSCNATSSGWTSSSCSQQIFSDPNNFPWSNSLSGFGGYTTEPYLRVGAGSYNDTHTDLEFRISKVTITGSDINENWLDGWSLSWNTTFSFPQRATGQQQIYWNSLNDGAGSGLDADRFGGYAYGNYLYGTSADATSTITDYNNANNRTEFLTGNNATNAPFTYSAGNPWSSVMNVNFAHTGVNWQLGMTSRFSRLAMRREYGAGTWQDWVEMHSSQHVRYDITNQTTTTLAMDDEMPFVRIDASSNTVTVTLPESTDDGIDEGHQVILKCVDSTNTVTIQRDGSDTIEEGTSVTMTKGDALQLVLYGTDWMIIN